MTQTIETLSRRTEAMQGIRGIVHTMKTLSAINAHPYEQAARSISAWSDTVLDGFQAFFHQHRGLDLTVAPDALPVIIAFGSDQGLCGNYNEVVTAAVAAHPDTGANPKILCIGAQMEDALTGAGLPVAATLMPPASTEGLGRLAGDLVKRIDAADAATPRGIAVTLAFTERAAGGQQAVVTRRILPLSPVLIDQLAKRPWTSRSLPFFNMPTDRVFAALMRNYLFASLYRAAAEALVTENAARLSRMQQAERSIDDRLAELQSQTHTARQAAITEELLDIISGFEALKLKNRNSTKAKQQRG